MSLFEFLVNYFLPLLYCEFIVFFPVKPPVTVGTVQIAHIDDISRTVNWTTFVKKFVACNLKTYVEICRRFSNYLGEASTHYFRASHLLELSCTRSYYFHPLIRHMSF